MKSKELNQIRQRRKRRTRAKIFGTSERPRLSVFRSHRYTYAQLINDIESKTLASASTQEINKSKVKSQKSKVALAEQLGELVAKKAVEKGVKKAVFDRRQYRYHGRIKAVSEGARKKGLQL